jgi:hypothetical protein
MAKTLTQSAIDAFTAAYPIYPDMVGRYGIVVRFGDRWIDVYRIAGGLGYLDVTGQQDALGMASMVEGEIRQIQPVKGAVYEAGVLDILEKIPQEATVDPTLLQSGAQSAAQFIAAVAAETGKDLGLITGGVSQGLFNVSVFGLPLPLVLFIGAAGYVGFLLLSSGALRFDRR